MYRSGHAQIQEAECLLCDVAAETSVHLFKDCTIVKEFWRIGSLQDIIPSVSNVCLTDWVWLAMDVLDNDQQALFFSNLWAVWAERNKRVHERVEVKRNRGQTKWECPPSERLKLNIDGAFNGSSSSGEIGVVVRNENDVGIAAVTRSFKHARSALNMEFEACYLVSAKVGLILILRAILSYLLLP
ncbi:hypothetical protein ACLB2K_056108 [Fragaria x ananassa]